MYVNKLIGKGEYGLFYTSHDCKNNLEFNAVNVTLNGLYQLYERGNSFVYVDSKSKAKLTK